MGDNLHNAARLPAVSSGLFEPQTILKRKMCRIHLLIGSAFPGTTYGFGIQRGIDGHDVVDEVRCFQWSHTVGSNFFRRLNDVIVEVRCLRQGLSK